MTEGQVNTSCAVASSYLKYGTDLAKYDSVRDRASCSAAGKQCLFVEGVVCTLKVVDPTVDLSAL